MKSNFPLLVLAALFGAVAYAEIVPIPGDYSADEIPVSSVISPMTDLILPGNSTSMPATYYRTQDRDTEWGLIDSACFLTYTSQQTRRVIPKATPFQVKGIRITTFVDDRGNSSTPGECFVDDQSRSWTQTEYDISTPGNFVGKLSCVKRESWLGKTTACQYYDQPKIEELRNLSFSAEKDLLSGAVIH